MKSTTSLLNSLIHANMEEEKNDREDTTSQPKQFWCNEATKLFLQIMENYMDDLNHPSPRRRKHVFENACTELSSQGYCFTTYAVKNKWKTLMRVYRGNRERMERSGKRGYTYQFYPEMDKLIGSKVSVSNKCSSPELSVPAPPNDDEGQGSEAKQRRLLRSAEREAAKERRHRERMAIEQAKLNAQKRLMAVARQKIELIRKLIKK